MDQTRSTSQRTALGAGLMVGARLFTRFVDLGTMLVLTRVLRPADFGLVAIAMSLVAVLEAVFEMPLNQALLRLATITRDQYDTAFTLSLLRGAVLGALLIGAAWPFAALYHDPRLVALVSILSLAPAFRGLQSPRLAEFQKRMSFWRDVTVEISAKLVSFAVAVAVALATRSYWAIALGTIVYAGGVMAQSYVFAPYRPRLTLRAFRTFSGFVGWMSVAQIVGALNWQFERMLLGKLRPVAALGLFATASDLASIPFLALFGPMARPLLAGFASLEGDRARLAASYQKASVAMVAVGLPILVGESLLAEPSVRLVLGVRWLHAVPYVRWLSLSLTPALFTLPVVPLFMAANRTELFLRRNLVELGTKLPLATVGVLLYGFAGIIGGRFVSEVAADAFSLLLVRRMLGLTIRAQLLAPWRSLLALLALVLAVLLSLAGVPPGTTPLSSALCLAAAGAAGAAAYGGATAALWWASGCPDGIEAMVVATAARVLGARGRVAPAAADPG